MATEKPPSSRLSNGGRPLAQKRNGSDPPHDGTSDSNIQPRYPQRESQIGAWRHAYALARKPWVFVPLIGSYWVLSIMQLVAKFSTVNVASFLISSFVLILAIAHNLIDVMECLGTILKQIGVVLGVVGGFLSFAGCGLRNAARRLRAILG